jgi:hypothetical protein
MRFVLPIFLLCVSSCQAQKPSEASIAAGMQLAKTSLIERLRGCLKLPENGMEPSMTSARQISEGGEESFEMELVYEGRNFFTRVSREPGGAWELPEGVVPDPCTDDSLVITVEQVNALNTQGLSWTAAMDNGMIGKSLRDIGITPDASLIEWRAKIAKESEAPPHARRVLLDQTVVGGVTLPDSYDATDRYHGDYPCKAFDTRHQLACGTCTHFTTSSVFGARLCLNSGRESATNVLMSPRQLSDCVDPNNRGCPKTGYGVIVNNLDYYVQEPARGREEWCMPYKEVADVCDTDGCPLSRTFPAKNVRVLQSVPIIQAELLLNGPMVMAMMIHNSIFAYSSGVYTVPTTTLPADWVGGHAMMLVGWGTDNSTGIPYWKLQNSWGREWGQKGYWHIRRGTNECDIENRDIRTLVPKPSLECPNSPCANGSITLSDCTCQCVGPVMGGALCDTIVNPCQNGGRLDRHRIACLCPTGMSGTLCQYGFRWPVINTAGCSKTTYTIKVPYTTDVALDYRSTIGLYALTQNSPFSYIRSARICSAPGPCPLTGNVTLVIYSLAAGRYRIMLSPATSSGAMYNFDANTPAVAFYMSVLSGTCSTQNMSAAMAINAPDVPIVASETAELALIAQAEPRLDVAAVTRAELAEQGEVSLSFYGVPFENQNIWIGTPRSVCFHVPPWFNQEKKNKIFQIVQQVSGVTYNIWTNQYPAIDFVANPSAVSPNTACFTASIPITLTSGPYTMWMLTSDQAGYITTPPFNTSYIEMKVNTYSGSTNWITLNMAWNIKAGTPMADDMIQVRSRDGTNAAAPFKMSTATNLKQVGTFSARLYKLPVGAPTQGPYAVYYYRGNSSNITAWTQIPHIVWTNFRL